MTESWMQKEAEKIRLCQNFSYLVKNYKKAESEMYFTLYYQKYYYPLLPYNSTDLFSSYFEKYLEKCLAQKHEIDWPDPEEEEPSFVETPQNQNGVVETGTTDSIDLPKENSKYYETVERRSFKIVDDPQKLRIVTYPLELFDIWRDSMEYYFKNVKERKLE